MWDSSDSGPGRFLRDSDDPKVMEFWEHLEELRWVIFKSLIALGLAMGACLSFTPRIYRFIRAPLDQVKDAMKITLRYDGPTDAIVIKLKMALLGGAVLAIPFIGYFIWTFVAPGLKPRERRAVRWAVGAGAVCFLCGVLFGYKMLFLVLPILAHFSDPHVANIWSLRFYMNFAFRLLLGVGIAFELPVVIVALVRIGLLDIDLLRKGRPYAVVVAMVIAAILTPPDAFTMLMLGGPLIGLYEIGVLAARWQASKGSKRENAERPAAGGNAPEQIAAAPSAEPEPEPPVPMPPEYAGEDAEGAGKDSEIDPRE